MGLRFERRNGGAYYKVVLHLDDACLPVGDEDAAALTRHGEVPDERLRAWFLDLVGSSAYLKDRVADTLRTAGGQAQQIAAVRQALQALSPAAQVTLDTRPPTCQ